jgi:hypothetical protein
MSEPEQNQKSENPHASFSDDKRIIERLARRIIGPSLNSIALGFDTWLEMLNKTMGAIEAAWPDLEKHFRHKLKDERHAPQTTDTISNKINALACALREVEKTVPKAQARYKTQSDDTKESILKALSVLAFEARKECRPSQVVNAEKPSQKYPDAYYDLDSIANRITFKAQLYPNLSFSELQKEIRADLNVLEEKL